MVRRASLVIALALTCACGSRAAPAAPEPPECTGYEVPLVTEARMLAGQGYLHRALARADEAVATCPSAEGRALRADIVARLDPGSSSTVDLIRAAAEARAADDPVAARIAAARALAAAERSRQPAIPELDEAALITPRAVAFDADGHHLTIGLPANRRVILSLSDPSQPPRFETGAVDAATRATAAGVTAHADGGELVLAGIGRERRLHAHNGAIVGLALSPDGLLVASAGDDRRVRLFDATLGVIMAVVAIGADDAYLVVAADGRVDGSDATTGGPPLLRWRAGELALPGFIGWQRQHRPGLLANLARRRTPF